ncbi:DUF2244 domain-containing protein [Rhodobacteraceae bacterium M382]|nr:DUF2244 domain-containing protein [Rhodobacteraceae bacterium M382]
MPYQWNTTSSTEPLQVLQLWPHQSLPPKAHKWFILGTAVLIALPLLPFLGTVVLWGLLPFLTLAVLGMWYALDRNRHDQKILEILELGPQEARLERHNPHGAMQDWSCNRYWTTVEMHEQGGPVPYYITLRGNGREVEIGAFLSEDERKALYHELSHRIRS